ncbi:hypothetical protein [Sphaerisporangium corydalis]|uniref:Uncharacterized protein n=1 Tax=Sphaerisporangium corydalis TaxID=1441875 RepID=A0ABV9EKP8_9ACTN|nr:hypothetical protein [Sphaerisporangium corydalis]
MNVEVDDFRIRPRAGDPVDAFVQMEGSPPQLLHLTRLRIVSASRVDVRSVELSAGELQGTAYAYGSGQVGEFKALVTLTDNGDGTAGQLSVRVTDSSGSSSDWIRDPVSRELVPRTS